MSSYSIQLGLNGQYPPQNNVRDERQHPSQHYPHPSYFPPPYPMHPQPFPGASGPYQDRSGAPLHPQYNPPPTKLPSLKEKLFNLAMGQEVEVCVRSNVFVVGFVVSVLTFFEKIAGFGYEIRYRTSGGESTDVFGVERIRPR
ncbi:hypothetical protein E1B28_011279 [Marasmius oreades]|uniref:Uncharacterized protein n=1 Tax=Marasmius oreades TaxID=181124 RepID=A0A9P7UPT3_9AGAR|nr:uncharacterized protein E1B28_011279 [Marasmius oreades]KAG7089613.1 hypothetical protein E1B28_011279 [Marasmius oreades]